MVRRVHPCVPSLSRDGNNGGSMNYGINYDSALEFMEEESQRLSDEYEQERQRLIDEKYGYLEDDEDEEDDDEM